MKYLFIVFALIPSVVFGAAPTDYISCWDVDETSGTRVDANTTNSNDLTDTNTVLSTTGVQGNAADFESSTSEYLTITDANQTDLDVTTQATWAFWVQLESDTDPVVIDKTRSGAAPTNSYWLQLRPAADVFRFANSAEVAMDVSTTIDTGVLYHFIVTYNAGTITVYKNNVSVGTASNGTSLTNTTAPFTLGRVNKYASNYLDGWMDVVEVYNRVITADERTAIYNAGAGVSCTGRTDAPAAAPQNDIIFY